MNVAQQSVVLLLRLYRAILSPVLGFLCGGLGLGCRFSPTCSQYALEAVQRHGVMRGLWLALIRLSRCHPWGTSGHDPVPNGRAGCPQHAAGLPHRHRIRRAGDSPPYHFTNAPGDHALPEMQGETHGS